jgi:signal transduction histidine kinase
MRYKIKKGIVPIALLLFSVACHSPVHDHEANDANFQSLLEKGKNYATQYPYHTDSALMILLPLLRQQQGDEKTLNRGKVLNIIGVAYDIKGVYDSAAFYLYEASRLAEEIRDDSLQISVYVNLGILQFELKNADEAIEYYSKSLAIAEKFNDTLSIAKLLNNIGNAHMTITRDFEKAIPYLERSMEASAAIGYDIGYKTAGFNLAEIYKATVEPDKALHEINRILAQYGFDRYAGFTLGDIHFNKGNYRQAIQTFKELLIAPQNSREFEFEILKKIADTYKATGNADSTVVYLEKSYALRDTLHNQRTVQTIHELKIGYETEKKEAQIAALKDEKRLMMWLGIAGGGVLLAGLAALFFLWRWTVQKRRLAEKQKQFAEQQIIQLEQEKRLIATQAVLDGEVQERTRLARDLHDGLGSMLTGVKLNLESLKSSVTLKTDEVRYFNNAMNILDDSVREMRRVAHHLMPDALSRFGLKAALKDFCANFSIIEFVWFGNDERLHDRKMEVMIYRIIHELVNNALKHSGAAQIGVNVMREDTYIAFTVFDNGCGFDRYKQVQGMGLQNIRERVSAYNGRLEIDTNVGKGTEINVELQITN